MDDISSIMLRFIKAKKTVFIMLLLLSASGMILSFYRPIFSQRLIDDGLNTKEYSMVIYYISLIVLAVLIQQMIEFIQTRIFAKLKNLFVADIYSKVFIKTYKIKNQFINKTDSTSLSGVISSDISNISLLFDRGMLIIINYSIITLGGIIGLLSIDILLTILILFFVPIKLLLITFFSKKLERLNVDLIKKFENFFTWWGDIINGNKEIKLWGLYNRKSSILNNMQQQILKQQIKCTMIDCYNTTIDVFLEWSIRALIYIIAGKLVCNGKMTVGTLLAFITYTEYIIGPVSNVLYIKLIIAGIRPSMKHLNDFMQKEDEVNLGVLKPSYFDTLELKDVCFCYDDKEILHKVNLRISKGEKIAIIGKNGSGKTTLINLLIRILTETSGDIFMNNKKICEYNLEKYRSVFSVCSQETYLFKDTLRGNLDLRGELSDEEIVTRCNIYEEISKEMLDGEIDNNASNISGGEKQKVSFMRALCNDADIFILDEPDASLDITSTKKLDLVLHNLKDKTVILITHKKCEFNNMNSVYELKQGVLTKI